MSSDCAARLALIVRGHPWQHRAARVDLDFALAAAAMDFNLEVYFLGAAVLQLAAERDSRPAMLPAGYRGWAALPDLTKVKFHAEPEWLEHCNRAAIRLLLPVQALNAQDMQAGWRRCLHVLVI